MIFAFATDDKTLLVFPSESEAVAYCEGVDVEEGLWCFFDANGEPLEAVFTKPNSRGSFTVVSGIYSLRPSSPVPAQSLLEKLPEVATVEGKPPLNTVGEIKRLLTSRSRRTR
jgi:hypothetical protein